jgi:aldose 1-dehydrogenase [NAD(P)+]
VLGLFGFMRYGSAILKNTDIQNLVYKSISVVGLINGQKPHFESAMRDLVQWKHIWPETSRSLVTRTIPVDKITEFPGLMYKKTPGEIKTKIAWI